MTAVRKTFAENTVGYAAEINTYLMNQVVVVCNDATDRAAIPSPIEGMVIYRKDTDAIEVYNGAAWLSFDTKWQTYTPVIYTNNVAETLGNGSSYGKYFRVGKTCHFKTRHVVGSTTAWNGAGLQEISLPVAGLYDANFSPLAPFGIASVYRSGVANSTGTLELNASGLRGILLYNQYGNTAVIRANVTNTAPASWATSDVHVTSGTYELA